MPVVVPLIGAAAAFAAFTSARLTVMPALVSSAAVSFAVAATGTPVVVLLRHGRALALHGAVHDARVVALKHREHGHAQPLAILLQHFELPTELLIRGGTAKSIAPTQLTVLRR